jgi:hypothetical protein
LRQAALALLRARYWDVIRPLPAQGQAFGGLMPPFSAEWPGSVGLPFSVSDSLKHDGYSGRTGAVQTFFLRGQEGPWTAELIGLHGRQCRHPSGARGRQGEDLSGRRSANVPFAADRDGAVAEEHRTVAEQVRRVLAAVLWNAGDPPDTAGDRLMVERARKLQNYFTQPFFVAEPYTHRPGTYVRRDEALHTCRDILEGRYDDIPVKAFYFAGGIEEIRNRAAAVQ